MSSVLRLSNSFRGLSVSVSPWRSSVRSLSSTPLNSFIASRPHLDATAAPAATPTKKAASAPKKKKVLTEKQKEAKKAKKEKEASKLKKLQKEAWAKPYKLTAYNIYVKEKFDTNMTKTHDNFKALSEQELEEFKTKANERYDEILSEYMINKPEKPLNAFANYTKKNFVREYDGQNFSDTVKDLSAQWAKLTSEEKEVYKSSIDVKDYQERLKAWKAKRLDDYIAFVEKAKLEKKQKQKQ